MGAGEEEEESESGALSLLMSGGRDLGIPSLNLPSFDIPDWEVDTDINLPHDPDTGEVIQTGDLIDTNRDNIPSVDFNFPSVPDFNIDIDVDLPHDPDTGELFQGGDWIDTNRDNIPSLGLDLQSVDLGGIFDGVNFGDWNYDVNAGPLVDAAQAALRAAGKPFQGTLRVVGGALYDSADALVGFLGDSGEVIFDQGKNFTDAGGQLLDAYDEYGRVTDALGVWKSPLGAFATNLSKTGNFQQSVDDVLTSPGDFFTSAGAGFGEVGDAIRKIGGTGQIADAADDFLSGIGEGTNTFTSSITDPIFDPINENVIDPISDWGSGVSASIGDFFTGGAIDPMAGYNYFNPGLGYQPAASAGNAAISGSESSLAGYDYYTPGNSVPVPDPTGFWQGASPAAAVVETGKAGLAALKGDSYDTKQWAGALQTALMWVNPVVGVLGTVAGFLGGKAMSDDMHPEVTKSKTAAIVNQVWQLATGRRSPDQGIDPTKGSGGGAVTHLYAYDDTLDSDKSLTHEERDEQRSSGSKIQGGMTDQMFFDYYKEHGEHAGSTDIEATVMEMIEMSRSLGMPIFDANSAAKNPFTSMGWSNDQQGALAKNPELQAFKQQQFDEFKNTAGAPENATIQDYIKAKSMMRNTSYSY